MRSSGSTLSLPERPIRIGIVLVGDDQPRKCTGRRLVHLGLATEVRLPPGTRTRPVVLDPYARRPLTSADRPRVEADGLVAVDCSWNRLSSRHQRAGTSETIGRVPVGRRLPMLIAANPQHFGRLGELNTAEALAAALWLLGYPRQAARILAGFAGGPAFLDLNRERLDRYARASSPEELVREERSLFSEG